ncbi:MAG TPA: hypothetical protein VKZ53_04050 [Candidatus Angelobacter sp.]|nr:hypothetical protein [Candidatus Angelobacter sp.]
MKKLVILTIAAMFAMMSSMAFAQAGNTATGTLTVTATVNSSITLVFVSDPAGVALASGSGTNTATLAFGNVQAFGGALTAGTTRTVGATSFTVSSPVDVVVSKANSASTTYKLTAQLAAAPANTETLSVGGVAVTNTAAATIGATVNYGSTPEVVALTIPFAVASGTAITDAINFTATSN